MRIGGVFLNIDLGSDRNIRRKNSHAVFVNPRDFNQPVLGDRGSVCCNYRLRRIQTEFGIFVFASKPDTVLFVRFQLFQQADDSLLPLVYRGYGYGCDFHLLTGINKLRLNGLLQKHHAIRRLFLSDFKFSEKQRLTDSDPVCGGRKRCHFFSGGITQCFVRRKDVFQRVHPKNSAFQALHVINGRIDPVLFSYGREYLALLFDGYRAHLGLVFLIDANDCQTVLLCGVALCNIKIYRGLIQNIAIRSRHLYQRIPDSIRQLLRCEQRTV